MAEKLCLCSVMEAGEFDNKYRDSNHHPEAINWYKNSDGSYETGSLKDEEVNAKVKCQCGKYMETHLVGRYHKRILAVCSCDNPKPKIMEIMEIR